VNTNAQHVVLNGISYELGNLLPIESLMDEGLQMETVSELLAKQLSSVSVIQRPMFDAIRDCIRQTLEASDLGAASIDTVIVVTESFEEIVSQEPAGAWNFKAMRDRVVELLRDLGIGGASLLCATFGGCTNMLQAIGLASDLVRGGTRKNVLIVAAEKCSTVESRIMQDAVALSGDGVATCIVGADASHKSNRYRIDGSSIVPIGAARTGGDKAALMLDMSRAAKSAAASCNSVSRREPCDYDWLVLGNYNRESSAIYSRILGFTPERTFTANLGRFGHISFDPLINLGALSSTGAAKSPDAAMLFFCGPTSCGALAVTAC